MHQYSRSAYQMAAAEGATQVDLLVVVYNNLAQDLLLSAEAVRQQDIAERCRLCKHALLLLGHLESWLEDLDDAKLATSLAAFYRMLRSRLLHLQGKPDVKGFEELAQMVLDTTSTWQQMQRRVLTTPSAPLAAGEQAYGERVSFQA